MTTTISNYQHWEYNSPDYIDMLSPSSFGLMQDDDYDQDFMSNIEQDHNVVSPSTVLLTDLVCGVCGAPAHGYNFDQITCESCKAFFRRNALRTTPNLRCRFSGSCVININTRRQCTYCRLKKCFDIKMRKDWIRTEEETKLRQLQKLVKQQRKGRDAPAVNLPIVVRKKKRLMFKPTIEELVTNPIFTQSFFGLHRNLSDEDHVLLNNITNAYQLAANRADATRMDRYKECISLTEFINSESTIHQSLIYFYKGVPEFKQLDIDDQVSLIKSNMINIVHLHDILLQNFEESPLIGIIMSRWIGEDFHQHMSRARHYFYRFMKYPVVLKLALLILIFSIHQTDNYRNKIHVLKIQDFYTELLWRYLNHLFDETEAILSMEIISTQILQYQSLMDIMEEIVEKQKENNISDELMKSIFRLT